MIPRAHTGEWILGVHTEDWTLGAHMEEGATTNLRVDISPRTTITAITDPANPTLPTSAPTTPTISLSPTQITWRAFNTESQFWFCAGDRHTIITRSPLPPVLCDADSLWLEGMCAMKRCGRPLHWSRWGECGLACVGFCKCCVIWKHCVCIYGPGASRDGYGKA